MDKRNLLVKIVARRNCQRCETIKAAAERDGSKVEVVYFHDGGAELLATHQFLPILMPAVMVFSEDGQLVHRWCGVSQFLENWTGGTDEMPLDGD